MKAVWRLLTLPMRIVITVIIWICALVIRISGKILGLATGLLLLMALAVMTYSVKNAVMLLILALIISPVGLPMIAVGMLSLLNRVLDVICFV
jgi:hypothetical protein